MTEALTIRVTVLGKSTILRFGKTSAEILAAEIQKGRKLNDGEYLNELGIAWVMWSGYLDFKSHTKRLTELEFEDFYNMVEDNMKDVVRVIKVWLNSPIVKMAVDIDGNKN